MLNSGLQGKDAIFSQAQVLQWGVNYCGSFGAA